MQTKISTVLTTLQQVQAFMTANASALGTLNTSDSRNQLDTVESELRTHARSQAQSTTGTKAAQSRQRVLRNQLVVKYLKPIASIASTQLSQVPELAALRLPTGARTTQKLIAAASAMGQAASRYAPTFIGAGMDATFLADMQTVSDELNAGMTAGGSARTAQFGATTGLRVGSQQARKIVKQLDSLIVPLLADNQSLLAQWKSAKRFAGKTAGIFGNALDVPAITKPPVTEPVTPATPPVTPVTPATSTTGGPAAATPA